FVDDDNVLDPNYLVEASRISREWPMLGAWGSGTTIALFETAPPKQFEPWLGSRAAKRIYWSNVPFCSDATPWGAGLCVRAKVGDEYCRRAERCSVMVTGRRGKVGDVLWGGEDDDICALTCDMDLGVAVFPELR